MVQGALKGEIGSNHDTGVKNMHISASSGQSYICFLLTPNLHPVFGQLDLNIGLKLCLFSKIAS